MGRRRTRIFLIALLACACVLLAGAAWAADTLVVHESFTPNKLGVPTNLSITAKFSSTTGAPPSPIIKLTLYAPAGLRIDARGAGACSERVLQQRGPSGCPANSRAGFGGGVGLVELPKTVIHEPFTIDFFFAPSQAWTHHFARLCQRHRSSFCGTCRGRQGSPCAQALRARLQRRSTYRLHHTRGVLGFGRKRLCHIWGDQCRLLRDGPRQAHARASTRHDLAQALPSRRLSKRGQDRLCRRHHLDRQSHNPVPEIDMAKKISSTLCLSLPCDPGPDSSKRTSRLHHNRTVPFTKPAWRGGCAHTHDPFHRRRI